MAKSKTTNFKDIAYKAGQIITFTSVTTGGSVSFPAFITQFSDAYSVNYGGGAPAFGRTDPVKTYQSTSRRMNVGFDILGHNFETAKENFFNFSKFVKMLYPVYSEKIAKENNARTIKAPPMFRIKYVNYINSQHPDGLMGYIGGFSFQPDFKAGHFNDSGNMIPVKYSVSFSFEPIHERPLGADFTNPEQFLDATFPYNRSSGAITTGAQPARRT